MFWDCTIYCFGTNATSSWLCALQRHIGCGSCHFLVWLCNSMIQCRDLLLFFFLKKKRGILKTLRISYNCLFVEERGAEDGGGRQEQGHPVAPCQKRGSLELNFGVLRFAPLRFDDDRSLPRSTESSSLSLDFYPMTHDAPRSLFVWRNWPWEMFFLMASSIVSFSPTIGTRGVWYYNWAWTGMWCMWNVHVIKHDISLFPNL